MGKTALITGASSGIGKELALLIARYCDRLVLVARNFDALKEIADDIEKSENCSVLVIAADLSAEHASEEIFEQVRHELINVDILINNAGSGLAGPFLTQTADDDIHVVNLNITSLIEMCRLFGQVMVNNNGGQILNVASSGAFQPGPYTAVYYASKSFVYSFSLALANEWKNSGVQVSVLCPGATRTNFASRAGKADIANAISPDKTAEIAWQGLKKGKTIIIPGFGNKLAIFASKIIPDRINATIVRKIQQKQYNRFHI